MFSPVTNTGISLLVSRLGTGPSLMGEAKPLSGRQQVWKEGHSSKWEHSQQGPQGHLRVGTQDTQV